MAVAYPDQKATARSPPQASSCLTSRVPKTRNPSPFAMLRARLAWRPPIVFWTGETVHDGGGAPDFMATNPTARLPVLKNRALLRRNPSKPLEVSRGCCPATRVGERNLAKAPQAHRAYYIGGFRGPQYRTSYSAAPPDRVYLATSTAAPMCILASPDRANPSRYGRCDNSHRFCWLHPHRATACFERELLIVHRRIRGR